ncbi:hypothetical protein DLAC_06953 [Tieghemostelium lacteum]|uniref:Uncharacterized protein n=1 Tax=Tieghemostelium lacteum TaxID=361077 RepID=A0A151ZDT0_TIELA|nr:hypothetical protein DLAC_06953 [Tieghemostelium lacteum]|eukprot:KYQ92113.1 hypothetical protein DLAC_06953 [Tieghemostelium lacteum]
MHYQKLSSSNEEITRQFNYHCEPLSEDTNNNTAIVNNNNNSYDNKNDPKITISFVIVNSNNNSNNLEKILKDKQNQTTAHIVYRDYRSVSLLRYIKLPKFKNLKEISLIQFGIVDINSLSTMLPFHQITYLDLSNNLIEKVTAFKKFEMLEYLILDHNNITSLNDGELDNHVFRDLKRLKVLSMCYNYLLYMYSITDELKQCTSLKHLYLKNNPYSLVQVIADQINGPPVIDEYPIDGDPNRRNHKDNQNSLFYTPSYRSFFSCTLTQLLTLDGVWIDREKELLDANFVLPHQHPPKYEKRQEFLNELINRELYRNNNRKVIENIWHNYGEIISEPPVIKKLDNIINRPRQLEYSPFEQGVVILGSSDGLVKLYNFNTQQTMYESHIGHNFQAVLGIAWMTASKVFVGNSDGTINLIDYSPEKTSSREFANFQKLTSLHCNSDLTTLGVCGNSLHLNLIDTTTGQTSAIIKDAHTKYINVIKFAHRSPSVFVSTSFDGTVKVWDLRSSHTTPNYTIKTGTEINVLSVFSKDDKYVLSSSIDNQVTQYHTVDGSIHLQLPIKKTYAYYNFTRSYYTCSENIIVGSCQETVMRIYNSSTGKLVRDVELPPSFFFSNRPGIQSLRGDPFNSNSFLILPTDLSNLIHIKWSNIFE